MAMGLNLGAGTFSQVKGQLPISQGGQRAKSSNSWKSTKWLGGKSTKAVYYKNKQKKLDNE